MLAMLHLFLLCAVILSTLIKQSNDKKCIAVHGEEHKIGKYAHDTSLVLDGSPNALFTAFDTFDFFPKQSWLKVIALKQILFGK